MVIAYMYKTSVGLFQIRLQPDGRWAAMFEDEHLGPYPTAWSALDDLVGGHTYTPSCGDAARCGLPDELSEWKAILSA